MFDCYGFVESGVLNKYDDDDDDDRNNVHVIANAWRATAAAAAGSYICHFKLFSH